MAPADSAVEAQQPLALRQELLRKALHLGAAVIPVAYELGASRALLVKVVAAGLLVALMTEGLRRTSPAGGALYTRAFGPLTREHEARDFTGATWLLFSCLALVALLSREAAIAALWCATVGDPAATIAGKLWTSIRVPERPPSGRKTLMGSLACAAVSFAGAWLLATYSPVRAAMIGAAAALGEALPTRIDDNVRVAAAAGVVAQLLA